MKGKGQIAAGPVARGAVLLLQGRHGAHKRAVSDELT
jgi:hypothetical protein